MSTFDKLKAAFDANWTTVLVGWNGLGVLSPWPDRWIKSPPLLSANEISAYCDERFAFSSGLAEEDLILAILTSELHGLTREEVQKLLTPLSAISKGDPAIELRKWRLVMLEQTLATMPNDALYGLLALSEFWLEFGLPSDCPHEVQCVGQNTMTPEDYYLPENLDRLLARHRAWIELEKKALQHKHVG